jgi:hypothetical protein
MTTCIALLRGANVGRAKRPAMADLRELVEGLGDPHVVNRTPTSELWLAEFTDPDGNPLALMSDVTLGSS